MRVAIVGGGAAGFFMAIQVKYTCPDAEVIILERSSKVLTKVGISGGGRCNVTNSFAEVSDLKYVYPRGHKLLKRLFKIFNHEQAYEWFEAHDVPLTTQEDQCVFPKSQDAQSIIRCFLRLSQQLGIIIRYHHTVLDIESITHPNGSPMYKILCKEPTAQLPLFDKVAITTGGSPRIDGLRYLERLGHKIEHPLPSLFTFNLPNDNIRSLMGTVVENAIASIPGTKFKCQAPLLVTHWGMSGPAILKLSSHAARYISENSYSFPLLVNWTGNNDANQIAEELADIIQQNPQKKLSSLHPFELPTRLWVHLMEKTSISVEKKCNELTRKELNKMVNTLCNDEYRVQGKGAFRDEFVTCGGVSLESINYNTMESKVCPNLFFAGEVLDIDGVTGGFNFQAAWTTAYVAALNIGKDTEPLEQQ